MKLPTRAGKERPCMSDRWTARRYRVRRNVQGPDVEVTAMQFTGTNTAELIYWLGIAVSASATGGDQRPTPSLLFHPDHPGSVCRHGDWIVRYDTGDIVVMSADQFAASLA